MAGLIRLEEKHKRAVEMWLRGVRRQQIADECGVSVSTVHAWMKDPMLLSYMELLVRELEVRRQKRLEPALNAVIELALLAIREAIAQLQSPIPAERLKAPSLRTIMDAVETLHGLERLDAGAPTTVVKTITDTAERHEGQRRERTMFELLMDEVVIDRGPPEIDVTPEPKPEETE